MKKLLFVACAGLCSALFADTTLYVKPGGTGAGTSWSDAADLATAVAAAREGTGVTTIYAAKGVYYPTAMLQLNGNVALYGGFAGVSMDETPATRDLKVNETIISGDTKKNDRWELFHALSGTSVDTGELIIQDGAIFVPSFTNDYDTVAPLASTVGWSSDNLIRVISITNDTTIATAAVVDGLTVQGGGWANGKWAPQAKVDGGSCDYGGALFVGAGASPVVRNCRFVGCSGMRSLVYFCNTDAAGTKLSSTPTFVSNTVAFCRTEYNGALMAGGGEVTLAIKDTTFRGNVHATASSDNYSCADVYMQSSTSLDGCFFTRSHNRATKSVDHKAICVSVPYPVNADVRKCRFEKCSGYTTLGESVPVVSVAWHDRTLADCQFVSNLVIHATTAAKVTAASCLRAAHSAIYVRRCAFIGNRLVVSSSADAAQVGAATALVAGKDQQVALINCVLSDNTVSVTATGAGATTSTARGVLAWNSAAGSTTVALCHCTAQGADPSPDLLTVGDSASSVTSRVVNSVLWADGDTPRVAGTAALPALVESSIVRSATNLPAATVIVSDTYAYDPGLQPLVVGDLAYPQISRRDPGNSGVYDVSVFVYYGTEISAYGRPSPSTEKWREVLGKNSTTKTPLIGDILGTSRPTGQFLKGALQSLTPIAVTYTFDLGKRGLFENGTPTNALHLFTGDAVTIPPYTVNAGYTFRLWHDSVPAVAGDQDKTFMAYYLGPVTEIDDWDDLPTVVALVAGSQPAGSEIRLRAGSYTPASDFVMPSTVKLVGESGAVVRRSAENQWTIKNPADKASADKGWLEISGITFDRGGVYPGVNPVRLTDCVFTNCVNDENGALCLYTNAVVVNCGFYDSQMAVKANGSSQWPICFWATNCVFRGNRNAPAGGGRQFGAAVTLGSCSSTVFSECLFEKNRSSNAGSQYGIFNGGPFEMTRCQFVDNVCTGDTAILTLGYNSKCSLDHTLFLRNRVVGDRGGSSTAAAAIINDANIGTKTIVGCVFLSNVVARTEAVTSGSTSQLPCSILYRMGTYTAFRYNYFEGNSVTAAATDPGTTSVCSVVSFDVPNKGYACSMEGNTFHDNTADEVFRLRGGGGDVWIWNSLLSGAGAEANPIGYPSDEATAKVYYRRSVAPMQDDARISRDDESKQGPVAFAQKMVEVDGLPIRPIQNASAARTRPVKWYFTSNAKKMYYNESLGAYRRMDGDCWDSYMTQYTPYTTVSDMFGEVPEGRKALAGAYQNRVNCGMVIMVR